MDKRKISLLFLFLILVIAISAASQEGNLTLTIAHINDTHAHIEPTQMGVTINGEKIYMDIGGFPAVVSKMEQLKEENTNFLTLHAGDVFQGTLYFKKYHGLADLEFLELMNLDAMVLGNHEFDKGS